ncbi:hypothetical protein DSO57_1024640 [Entomophthora muscae]|uniref:Uncharacterized protein n=2 Tax=Entomophthora muscae TaxID=34485 RepID=A0ACC2SRK6_9FUNG|nr:hypothetical protein DSO57_1019276 [Entomophthora muscae]KAJ9064990.1 hypothetical protein DSO57_1024640 [Entomophthora muscae]
MLFKLIVDPIVTILSFASLYGKCLGHKKCHSMVPAALLVTVLFAVGFVFDVSCLASCLT